MPEDGPVDDDARAGQAIRIAAELLTAAAGHERGLRGAVRRRHARLHRLVADPEAKDLVVALTDQVTRITEPRAAAHRLRELVAGWREVPNVGALDRLGLWLGARCAPLLPAAVIPIVKRRLRREMAGVTVPAEEPGFTDHLARRREQGVRCNVNLLGEAILGEAEAVRRRDAILTRLARVDVDYVSVKISSITSHVSPLAFDATVATVIDRLRPLFEAAAHHDPPKFVNLDMEEYHDLALTAKVFAQLLGEPALSGLDAGIVMQAYLPDVHDVAADLCSWARARRRAGGGRIKVRVVKGANLAMEHVEAELNGWPSAPYDTKADVDASYKRLLDMLLDARNDDAVSVGLASHNLFDVAWGLVLREELARRGSAARLELEMLEGMADAQAWATRQRAGDLLLYAPVVAHDDFEAAVAYLVRRLDENTAPGNFLTELFDVRPGNAVFERQAARFRDAVAGRHTVDIRPRRNQDRRVAGGHVPLAAPFANTADTDFALAANRLWLGAVYASTPDALDAVEPVTSVDVVDRAVAAARAGLGGWEGAGARARAEIVNRLGDVVDDERATALAVMAAEAAKTIGQGDPEVSEAADFARYYARSAVEWDDVAADDSSSRPSVGAHSEPVGVVVVAPPWNFPYAIPMGGVAAALAGGNTVILKPAPEARATARLVAEQCWRAGVPDDVLQFVPADDGDAGQRLITHPDVDAVILTGALATAELFLAWRPGLQLHGETSGKNAIVVTSAADVDMAIADIVSSAFLHAGQKCSAASLAIVDTSIYDDEHFRERLRDAASSLRCGAASKPSTDVGPLIGVPNDRLRRALTQLDPGESWLLEPQPVGGDERCWSPGIRLGVRPGSWFHRTECFGPVLGLIRVTGLDEAVEVQNGVEFGLTAGLQSLDPDEISEWTERVEAGNVYVNRATTGAIVRRQPFGGWKRSVVGPTVKAGGPNYVASLRRFADVDPSAGESYEHWWSEHFSIVHDPSALRPERNELRYRALPGGVALWVGAALDPETTERALRRARSASAVTGTRLVVIDPTAPDPAGMLAALGADRLRVIGDIPDDVLAAAHAAGMAVDRQPIVGHGRVELVHWLREQAISETRHRYGLYPHGARWGSG